MYNYILKNENAIYYECNYSCDNVIFLKLGQEAFFITDARYTLEANKKVKKATVIESTDLIQESIQILKKTKIKKIIFDGNDFSYNIYSRLTSSLSIKFINKLHFSKEKRIVKSESEIKKLKKASKLGREGFSNFAKYVSEKGLGKSEKYLYSKAIEFMSQQGSLSLSFEPIIAINKNSAKPHALPSKKVLNKSDLLLVDAGVKYNRYCSDRTCTSVADVKNFSFKREQKFKNIKHQKIYDVVLKAQETAINKARVGMKASYIDKLARDIIHGSGYGKYFVHSTGHGVGVDIHEFPNINSKNDIFIEENMVFTIEPGIYLPSEFGVRIEDTIVMKNNRAVIL